MTNSFLTNKEKLKILCDFNCAFSKLKPMRNCLGAILPTIQSWDKRLGKVSGLTLH